MGKKEGNTVVVFTDLSSKWRTYARGAMTIVIVFTIAFSMVVFSMMLVADSNHQQRVRAPIPGARNRVQQELDDAHNWYDGIGVELRTSLAALNGSICAGLKQYVDIPSGNATVGEGEGEGGGSANPNATVSSNVISPEYKACREYENRIKSRLNRAIKYLKGLGQRLDRAEHSVHCDDVEKWRKRYEHAQKANAELLEELITNKEAEQLAQQAAVAAAAEAAAAVAAVAAMEAKETPSPEPSPSV